HPQVPVALLPDVEGRLTDAELAADIADGGARLRLPERIGHLLLRELRPLHPAAPSAWLQPAEAALYSSFGLSSISGRRQHLRRALRRAAPPDPQRPPLGQPGGTGHRGHQACALGGICSGAHQPAPRPPPPPPPASDTTRTCTLH